MRVGRFAAVGVLNTLIDFAVFSVLALVLGLHVALANTVSYSAGIANSYVWNRHWTFSDRRSDVWVPELTRFIAANIGGWAVNTGIVWLIVASHRLAGGDGFFGVPATLVIPGAKVVALLGSMTFNYLAFRSWVFVGPGVR